MKVLVYGSGGREHAIAWKLSKSATVSQIYVLPGNAGTAGEKINNISIGTDVESIADFCKKEDIGLVVIGPEQPLVDGIADLLKSKGITCFGPSKAASKLEGSKVFCKNFMKKYKIPSASYEIFTRYEDAKHYVEKCDFKLVIKASGLAAGKGVIIPGNKDEALDALQKIMVDKVFGSSGDEVVIEEFLEGEECSVLAFCDGYTVAPMIPSQDHKRIFDGDKGPNTGGMGAYAPTPVVGKKEVEFIKKEILQRTVDGMRKEGSPYVGVLFAGIMVTKEGPKVLEFNCRMGDPETQVVLTLMSEETDLVQIMLACCDGYLDSVDVKFTNSFAATVVLASEGYPGSYPKELEITVPPANDKSLIFHAGTTKSTDGTIITNGGRVLCSTGVGVTLNDALKKAYESIQNINFKGMQYRQDIGHRALKLLANEHSSTYADAGVSIDRGNSLVENIKAYTKLTKRPGSDAIIGGFGGLFDLKAAGFTKDPILVSATDGVGTKLKIAQIIKKHDTIGIDLVAMNVNDLIVQGAEPLFFLDYFACGKLDVETASNVVKGIANGCAEAGCALIGGETAEMPGMYEGEDYDLAGFTVGAVERENILPLTETIQEGDIVLGIPSSGVHSNGYSMVRYLMSLHNIDYNFSCPFDPSKSVGDVLLTPTRIYIKSLLPVVEKKCVKAMAHITGGGLLENIPRVLPDNLGVILDASKWPLLPVFKWLKKLGNMSSAEMSRTFNCGIGMMLVVEKTQVENVKKLMEYQGEAVYEIGIISSKQKALNGEYVVKVINTETSWN